MASVVILSVFVFLFSVSQSLKIHHERHTRQVKRATDIPHGLQSEGVGCDIFIPNLIQEPIPSTTLSTGTFYIVRLKADNSSSGYITWSWKQNPDEHKYVYMDMSHHKKRDNFLEGGKWYQDSQWAFLRSAQGDWYHLINCGFPSMYAAWSNLKEENDGSGTYPLILTPHYPGTYQKEDFLWKPVMIEKGVYKLVTKAFGLGIATVSHTNYHNDSIFLQVQSMKNWQKIVKKNLLHEGETTALFTFEEANNDHYLDWSAFKRSKTTCDSAIRFTFVAASVLWIAIAVCCMKKETIMSKLHR